MAYFLHTATNTVELDLERDFIDNKTMNINHYMTLGGRIGEYKEGFYLNWRTNVNYLTSSEGSQINDWFSNATDLTFALDSGSSYTVRITNNSQPVKSVNYPYHDELSGNINLTQVY